MLAAVPDARNEAGSEAAPLADLLCAKLVCAVDRYAAWRQCGDGADRPGWLSRFRAWQRSDALGRSTTDELVAIEERLAAADDGRLRARLIRLFRLADAERDLLDCALAVAANPAVAEAFGPLRGGDEGAVSERLVVELFGHAPQPIMRPTSPLAIWSLLESGPLHARLGQLLAADPDVAAALFGKPGLDRRLAGCAESVVPSALPVTGWPVAETATEVARLVEMKRAVRILLAAPRRSGRLHFATAVADALGTRLVRISPGALDEDGDLYMRAQRLALLTGHGLFWGRAPLRWPPLVASAPIQFVALDPGVPPPPAPDLIDLCVDLPLVGGRDKERVWRRVAAGGPAIGGEADGRLLASARLGDIIAAAQHAPRDADAARALLRRHIRERIQGAGTLLEQPYERSDLVLPPRQQALLESILGEMRVRDRLLAPGDRRAKYGGLGQSALFHGPPGTGKTMAAQILARALDVELVRVDCASALSKYIGETAKNLRDIFLRVQGSGALLLFDEADALFARRTEVKDAHDRHANADTNYLLQLIEGFDGAAILATNKKENIDPAFIRRLRHVVDFGTPGPAERRALWRRHVEALSDAELKAECVADWAERLALLDLTPAQIKGAALSAAFARAGAGRDLTSIEDLLAGVDRELAKEGRALDRNLRARIGGRG